MSELDASAARNGELDVLNVSIKQLSDAAMAESVITRFTAGARFELKISGHHQTKYIYIYVRRRWLWPNACSPIASSDMIRRKSASERLAESRCKYIRNNSIVNDDEASVGGSIVSGGLTDYCETDEMDNVSRARSNRATPTSSHTTTTSSSCLSPILDHIGSPTNTMDDKYSNQLVPNLVERINCQLSKTNKKRISPKNSDSSIANHGMSNLEIQLRELITDNDTSTDVADEQMLLSQNVPSQIEPQEDLKESEHLYRAELKYITSSSTSSLSSMYSEPDEIDLQQSPISEIKPTLVAPPGGQQSSHYTNVVRSKSDISQLKNKSQKLNNSNRFRECFGEHIDRLFGSLSLESGSDPNRKSIRKSSDSSNVQNYTTSSLSHDSLDMIKPIASQVVPFGLLSQQKVSVAAKSSSTNELSSLESSHLSTGVTADQIYKNSLNHSKSTSKLTFENLIRHQQTLASSRSCHNLVVATLNNGTSVVERNARIIKWLFNCRKAMNQQAQHSTSVNACV
ncbi:hypothetical protein BLOT_008849 [Blomia tropicalis]|nr:hypothetical protein BLOT_008849 [Blomia tropicalis]